MKIVFVAVAALCLGVAAARQVPVGELQDSSRPAESGEHVEVRPATRDSRGWAATAGKYLIDVSKNLVPALVVEGFHKVFGRHALGYADSDGMEDLLLINDDYVSGLSDLYRSVADPGEQFLYNNPAVAYTAAAVGAYNPAAMLAYPAY